MGNLFTKSNRRINSIFMEGFNEEDESLLFFNSTPSSDNSRLQQIALELKRKMQSLENENKLLRNELLNYKNSINNEIYQINEKMNLVNKDLQSLLTNDKFLLQEYNNLKNMKNDDSNNSNNFLYLSDEN